LRCIMGSIIKMGIFDHPCTTAVGFTWMMICCEINIITGKTACGGGGSTVRSVDAAAIGSGSEEACDWGCYLARYGDLRKAYGSDQTRAASHYKYHGKGEGRDCTCAEAYRSKTGCNWGCYLDRYADLRRVFGTNEASAEKHYLNSGKGEGRNCKCTEATTVADEQLATLDENNFNDRGDSSLNKQTTYTYTLANGYLCALSGWTHTRNYAKGFLRNQAGNPQALVSGLLPGQQYAYAVYQYASALAGTNGLQVNGIAQADTTSFASDAPTAKGIATATAQGEIIFIFLRKARHVHLSGLAIAGQQASSRWPVGADNSNVCPSGSIRITVETLCKSAASDLGLKWGSSWSSPLWQKGCYKGKRENHVYLNTHSTGGQKAGYYPVCQKVVQAEGDDSTQGCNWACYLNRYPDLVRAYGTDQTRAASHYKYHGKGEGRNCKCPEGFDVSAMVPKLQDLGASGCTSGSKCSQCQGDCDADGDCVSGLKCFQRSSSATLVNGCAGGGSGDVPTHDYCYKATCELGFNKCGYNWYQNQWNSGSPTQHWSKYCGCCGGTQIQQDNCKTAWRSDLNNW